MSTSYPARREEFTGSDEFELIKDEAIGMLHTIESDLLTAAYNGADSQIRLVKVHDAITAALMQVRGMFR